MVRFTGPQDHNCWKNAGPSVAVKLGKPKSLKAISFLLGMLSIQLDPSGTEGSTVKRNCSDPATVIHWNWLYHTVVKASLSL